MPPLLNNPTTTEDAGDSSFFGVDMRDSRTLAAGVLNAGENIRFDDLVPQTRRGVLKPAWSNLLDAGAPGRISPFGEIFGEGVFQDPARTEWEIKAADGFIFRCRPNNYPVSIALPTGVAIRSRCTFAQAFDKVYCFRGQYLPPLRMDNFDDGFEDLLPRWNSSDTYAPATEIAYGPFIAVTSVARVNNTVTVTTTAAHGYVTGADITVSGAVETAYNGRFNITVVDEFVFTYEVAGAPSTPATGTITCSNMASYWKAKGTLLTLSAGELTSAATTATVTHASHGFSTGQSVTIAGATQTEYNGTYTITVTGTNTFTYPFAGSGTTPATGTITVRNNTLTLANHSPDANPNDWQRIYNILPNADNALYINNRLLVPTAYEPGSVDDYATINGLTLRKKDYIVATDYLDDIHFDFSDEFRINQGSADEIVDLAKFNENTVIVWKGGSWGVLSNVALDLTQLSLDMRGTSYGISAMGAWTLVGSVLLFMADRRGVVSIRQTEQNKLIGVDVPLSAPVQKLIDRINWNAGAAIRMENWNSKVYTAVPLDSATANSAILVFDLVAAARGGSDLFNSFGWTAIDTGSALTVREFFKLKEQNLERLFFAAEDGFTNQIEALDAPDQIADAASDTGLGFEEIQTRFLSRGYQPSMDGQKRPNELAIALQTLAPSYSVKVLFSGVNRETVVVQNKTRSRTRYFRPWDAMAWDATNVNDDQQTKDREDYSVAIPADGLNLGSGVMLGQFQEQLHTFNLSGRQGRSFQVEITNTQGRIKLLALRLAVVEGRKRKGIQI